MAAHEKHSLLERKFARTRMALAEVTTRHLNSAPIETLTVKSLCERVQISEAT